MASPKVATLKSVEAALKLVDIKKESLKKAYDDLQAHSSLLSSFSLSWSEIDAHFSSLQESLTTRFQVLQSSESPNHDPGGSDFLTVNGGNTLNEPQLLSKGAPVQDPSSSRNLSIDDCGARPELVLMCKRMDARGLRNFINKYSKERNTIREELVSLMRVFPGAGAIVLDAMEGFYSSNSWSKGDKDVDLSRLRKSCLDLLEVLIDSKPVMSFEVKERAKMLAMEWKDKVSLNGDSPMEALGFLNLIVAYDLGWDFGAGALLDYFVIAARFKQVSVLCRSIGLGDKINDLVHKLIASGKHLLAVKLIFEFKLTERFKPVPILKEHLDECKKFSKLKFQEGKNSKAMHDARSKEVNALKAVLKIIDVHKLDSEFPRQEIEREIAILEKKQKADKKVVALPPDNSGQPHQQQSRKRLGRRSRSTSNNKRPHTSALTGQPTVPGTIPGSNSSIHSFQQPHLPPTGLLPTAGPHSSAMTGLATVPGSVAGSSSAIYSYQHLAPTGLLPTAGAGAPAAGSYAGAAAGPYSMSGVGMGYTGNPAPATTAHPYDPYASTAYYGYGVPPQYQPNYYQQ